MRNEQHLGTGRGASGQRLLSEGKHLAKISLQFDSGDECALALPAVDHSEFDQCAHCLPNRHLAHAHERGDLLDRRQRFAWLKFAGLYLIEEALLNLVVKRNAAPAVQGRPDAILLLVLVSISDVSTVRSTSGSSTTGAAFVAHFHRILPISLWHGRRNTG